MSPGCVSPASIEMSSSLALLTSSTSSQSPSSSSVINKVDVKSTSHMYYTMQLVAAENFTFMISKQYGCNQMKLWPTKFCSMCAYRLNTSDSQWLPMQSVVTRLHFLSLWRSSPTLGPEKVTFGTLLFSFKLVVSHKQIWLMILSWQTQHVVHSISLLLISQLGYEQIHYANIFWRCLSIRLRHRFSALHFLTITRDRRCFLHKQRLCWTKRSLSNMSIFTG